MKEKKNEKNDKNEPSKAANDKEKRIIEHYERSLEQCLTGRGYIPLLRNDLFYALRIPEHHELLAKRALKNLVDRAVVVSRGQKYQLANSRTNVVTGLMSMHHRGFGFLRPDNPSEVSDEIFIPKHATMNAVDGDRVEVVVDWANVSEKGPEGRIVSILKRGRSHVAGIVREIDVAGNWIIHCPILGLSHRVIVQKTGSDASWIVGDRVVIKVLHWGSEDSDTQGSVEHHLGHISDPSIDVAAAIEEFNLRGAFPTKVVKEAESFGVRVTSTDLKERVDYREIETVTIDPTTAKDFDDAISLMKKPNGDYLLIVHIADVTHYVRSGTALDKEALQRCNSTYFPGTCVPMLPPELSDNLCSLKAGVARLTASVEMVINPYGELVSHKIVRSVIKSAKRFSYEEAKQVLDGKKKSKHEPLLRLMVELCTHLKRKRYERESIEFAMPEVVVMVDEKGVPTGFERIEYDVTHQMIEEFMLKANEVVAKHLTDKGLELPYRIHEEPQADSLAEFSLVAGLFGFKVPKKPNPTDLQQFFDQAMKTPYGQYLATQYIRCMRMAIYSPENIGHYGLRLDHYCHFTSPIRRYADLIVHRILFGEPIFGEPLKKITEACSEQERLSAKAENTVRLLKKLRLLDKMMNEQVDIEFEALVTRVKPFGIVFEIPSLMMEGFIHVSNIGDDYYEYSERTGGLTGSRGGKKYNPGVKIMVECTRRNLITLESDWSLVKPEGEDVSGREGRRKEFGRRSKKKGKSRWFEIDPLKDNDDDEVVDLEADERELKENWEREQREKAEKRAQEKQGRQGVKGQPEKGRPAGKEKAGKAVNQSKPTKKQGEEKAAETKSGKKSLLELIKESIPEEKREGKEKGKKGKAAPKAKGPLQVKVSAKAKTTATTKAKGGPKGPSKAKVSEKVGERQKQKQQGPKKKSSKKSDGGRDE
jgi:ribonuclease R